MALPKDEIRYALDLTEKLKVGIEMQQEIISGLLDSLYIYQEYLKEELKDYDRLNK